MAPMTNTGRGHTRASEPAGLADDVVYYDEPTARGLRGRLSGCLAALLNGLALALVAASAVILVAVVAIGSNPGWLNAVPGAAALAPATAEPLYLIVTPTPLAVAREGTPAAAGGLPVLPPEWTATASPTLSPTPVPASATARPRPSGTPEAATQGPLASGTALAAGRTGAGTATRTAAPTATATGPTPTPTRTPARLAYTLQNGAPTYMANYLNAAGCDWMGIAGQVFNLAGSPVINLTVHLQGEGLDVKAYTGTHAAVGPGGYAIPLGDHPVKTTGLYTLQLLSNTGAPLSDVITIDTEAGCDKNLIVANFVQNH